MEVDLDKLSNLPESLLCQVLLNLRTKDVVKTSVLSHRWRNLWRYVPGLDLEPSDFPDCNSFVSFVDSFLGFNSQSCLQKFELKDHTKELRFDWYSYKATDHFTQWINNVIRRKVQYLHFLDNPAEGLKMPLTVYICQSLVSLKLSEVVLLNPKSVSLPSLKVMYLRRVMFANHRDFELLISGCPVLESFTVKRVAYDNVKVLRVCSQSLLSFTHYGHHEENLDEDLVVVIDAPRLEKLHLVDYSTDRFIIDNIGSLDKVVINVMFNSSQFDPNDLPKRNMIHSFLLGISSVKDMIITSETLEVIYNFSIREGVPLFCNLSSLRANFNDYRWEMLPIFLESCPNLKSLFLGFERPWDQPISILPEPHSFLQTLESVEIVKPIRDDDAAEMILVSYFLENSTILKKFTFCLGGYRKNEESVILKKLLAIPRLSSSCQVIVR